MPAPEFSEEIAQKALEKYRSLRFWKISERMLFVRLKANGYPNETIADILSVSVKTIYDWLRIFREGGLEALAKLNYKGQPSKLNAYGEQLALELNDTPVATLKEAQHRIEKMTGIKRSLPQIRAFLQRNKLKRRKAGQIPSKADLHAQAQFREEKLKTPIKQAQNRLIRLLVYGCYPFRSSAFSRLLL